MLNQISHVHWHFVDLCTVILLDISKYLDVVNFDKIYSNTLHTIIEPILTNDS